MTPPASNLNLPPAWRKLRDTARAARLNAYSPYSKYRVGAALLASSGIIYPGCNVENASYGLTICAERSAVCSAFSSGEKNIMEICISLACRQFLYEFNPDMIVLLDNLDQEDVPPEVVRLSDLLPRGFRL